MLITSPPNARINGAYSISGSTTIMSSMVDNATDAISCFAAKLFPEPDTPKIKPLPFKRLFRLQIMRLCDTGLMP